MNSKLPLLFATCLGGLSALPVRAGDPIVDQWYTQQSGRYARIYVNAAAKAAGTQVTTWSNGSQTQSQPAYSGILEIYSSASWVYLRTTGLGVHVMGPWSAGFPNLPSNQKVLYRIPRTTSIPSTSSLTGLGSIGYFVDGVAMFDSRDAFYWNGTSEAQGSGNWNREAYVNEGATFDPAYAHQQQQGTYHYHANPIALRYLLGDHVDYNATTGTYSESTTAVTRHSPILGWVSDGFPIYGPYGYANAANPASGLRRMISGYQLRNGQKGTDNLTTAGRSSIPAWAKRLYGTTGVQTGPSVSTTYPLGRYMEDNAYLGDLGLKQGVDFDLDESNGRFCVTPEFPNGTYAYFVSIAADGTPVYPYNIGRAFHGSPTGGSVTTLSETVTTNFVGGASRPIVFDAPANRSGQVTLTWSAVEGGSYQLETSTNLAAWSNAAATVAATGNRGSVTLDATSSGVDRRFYRVGSVTVADYDPATGSANTGGGTGGGGTQGPPLASITPTSGNRGTTVTVTMTLGNNPPPTAVNPKAAALGTVSGTDVRRSGNTVSATFAIPATATPGTVTVSVTFPGPPGSDDVTFALQNGFTIR
jgi:hypothetical protein